MLKYKGFTLVELVVVIIIIGIFATIAIPKYMDMKNAAARANVQMVAGQISSIALVNSVNRTLGTGNAIAIYNCNHALNLISLQNVPAGGTYTLTNSAVSNGELKTCTITLTGASPTPQSANYQIIGTN